MSSGSGGPTASAGAFTVAVGNNFSGQACGFAPGSTVTFTINGTPAATVAAGSDGCATFTATATDPHLAIDGGTPVAVAFGPNTLVASGTNPANFSNTVTITATVVTAAGTAASNGSGSSGLAFTGADILATVVGGLALIALGFLVLTFVRRGRVKTSS